MKMHLKQCTYKSNMSELCKNSKISKISNKKTKQIIRTSVQSFRIKYQYISIKLYAIKVAKTAPKVLKFVA